MKITMPAIIYLDGRFYVTDGKIIKYTIKDNILNVPENRVRKQKSGWIIDKNSNFYTLNSIGKLREWGKKIPFITLFLNLVISQYEMIGPKEITIREMKEKMQKMPKNTPYKDLREDFIRHLNSYENDRILDKKVLDEWPL